MKQHIQYLSTKFINITAMTAFFCGGFFQTSYCSNNNLLSTQLLHADSINIIVDSCKLSGLVYGINYYLSPNPHDSVSLSPYGKGIPMRITVKGDPSTQLTMSFSLPERLLPLQPYEGHM